MSDWATTLVALVGAAPDASPTSRSCVAALVVLPGNRRPQTAMAWLVLILARAVPRLPAVPALRAHHRGPQAPRPAGRGERRDPRRPRTSRTSRTHEQRLALPPLVQTFARLNRTLAVLPLSFGNTVELISDYAGCVEAMRREVAGRHRPRARAVLHLGVGRGDRAVLRGAGARDRARRDRAVPLRPPRLAGHPGLQGDAAPAGGHRDPVGADAADPAAARARCAAPTCATTARSWSSTAGSRSAARRT